jgi:hypothetical protein
MEAVEFQSVEPIKNRSRGVRAHESSPSLNRLSFVESHG